MVFQIKLKKWGLEKNNAYCNLTLKIDFKILVKYKKIWEKSPDFFSFKKARNRKENKSKIKFNIQLLRLVKLESIILKNINDFIVIN